MADEFDRYTPITLTHAVNKIIPETLYLTRVLAGRVVTAPTESTEFDLKFGRRDLAPMGRNGDPAHRVDLANTFKTIRVTPPQIFLEDEVPASAVAQRRMAGQSPVITGTGNEGGVVAALNEYIADKQKNMVDSVARRIEWMFAQALTTGGIVYAGSAGRPFSVSFDVPEDNFFTAAQKWDASSSPGDPIVQLQQWRRTFAQQNGMLPTIMILGSAAADAFRSNAEVKSWLKSAGVQLLQINTGGSDDLITQVCNIPNVGTLVEYAQTYPADGTGAATPYIPADKLVMTHPSLWEMHYGAIYDFDLGDPPIAMAPRFSKIKTSQDGKNKALLVESHPLPVLTYDTGIMVIKVCGS